MQKNKRSSLSRLIADRVFGDTRVKAGFLLAALSTAPLAAQSITINGQGAILDTDIRSASIDPQIGALTVPIDGGASIFQDSDWRQGLVRIDNLFGSDTNQIPVGATVLGAFYQVRTGVGANDQSPNNIGMYQLTTGFNPATAVWSNSFGGDGVQIGSETFATPDSIRNAGRAQGTVVNFEITSSVANWAAEADPNAANLGWLITHEAGTDGWVFGSSNNATAANRPVFTAYYTTNTDLQDLVWNTSNTTGTLNTNAGNTPWLDPLSAAAAFRTGDTIVLSQDAASPVAITVDAAGATPAATVVSHNSGTYTLSGGSINLGLTKTNAGTLVLNSANNFTSVSLDGGVIESGAANALGTFGTISMNGGTLRIPTTQASSKDFDFTNGSIEVAASQNFTLSGLTFGTGTVNKTGTGTLTITSGNSLFTGTVDIQAGRVILTDPGASVVTGGDLNASSIIVRNGAAFQFGSATPISGENPDFPNTTYITIEAGGTADWYVGEDFGGINLQGGAVNIGGGGPNIAGNAGIIESGTITGIGATRALAVAVNGTFVKQTAGTVTLTNTNINATGPVFINEGTLSTDAGFSGTGSVFLATSSTAATLQFRGAQAETVAKNLFLDSAGGTIDVQDAAAIKTWSGNILSNNTPSPLTKTGAGELRLTGNGFFSGPIDVAEGRLSFNNGSIGSGNTLSIADGASAAKLTVGTDTLSTLTLGTTTGAALQLGIDGTVTSPLLSVTDTDGFTVNGTNQLTLSLVGALSTGAYPLIDYDGAIGGSGFAGLQLSLPPRVVGNLQNDLDNTLVNLVVTDVDTVKWTGANSGAWDIDTTQNWHLVTADTATTYLQSDGVTFDDSAVGITNVALNTSVSPASLVFSNETKDYSIAGTGSISGITGLTKTGAAAVTIGTNNDFQGPIAVSGGILTLTGNNAFVGAITVSSGTLNLNGTNTLDGSLTVNGGNAVIGAGGSTISQPVVLSNGSLTFDGASTLTAGLTNSGGTLNVNSANTINAVTLSGGTTILAVNNALGASGTIAISNGATLGTTGTAVSSSRGLTFNSGGGIIDIPADSTFSLTGATAGNQPVTKIGAGTWEIMGTTSFTGTLDIQAGTVIVQGSVAAPAAGDFNATLITVRDGARFQFGQTTALTGENPDLPANAVIVIETGGVVDWNVGEDFGGINLDGGALNLIRGNVNMAPGTNPIESMWTSGTVTSTSNLIGGVGKINKTGPGTVTVTGAALNNTGGLNIAEGTLSTNAAITATGNLTLGTASTTGTLQLRHTAAFSLAKPVVLNGEGVIDVTEANTTVTLSGVVSGTGNLTKSGIGRLTLTGAANTFEGNVTVEEGFLALNATGLPATTNVAVSGSGTLEAPVTGQATFAGLNVASGGNLLFDVSTVPTIARLSVTTENGINLDSSSSVTIRSLTGLEVGTIPLIAYDTALGGGGLAGVNLVLPPRIVGSLVDNTADTRVDLSITEVDFIKWTGDINAAWDINTTSNWRQASDNAVTTFLQPDSIGDTVVLDDSAVGNTNIVLNTQVNPAQVTFDNSALSYSLSGTGSLGGFGGIVKNGTGTLTITTNNTNTGPTIVNGGTLQLGDGGTAGSLGSGTITVTAAGKLEFNRSDDTILSNAFTGNGELIHNGAGLTVLSSNSNGFTGTLTVNAGTVRLTNLSGTHNFNATSIVVNNGGTFEFTGPGDANLPNSTYITANPGGTVNWSLGENFGGIHMQGGTLNLTSAVTLVGSVANQFTDGTINGPSAFAGTTAINKTTDGTVTINGAALNTTGGLNIVAGTISTDSAITDTGALSFGDATSRGTLQLRTAAAATINKTTVVNAGGGVLDIQEAAATITSTGSLTLNAGATFVKAGAGELKLNGATAYGNDTTVQVDAGTLTYNPVVAPTIGTNVSLSIAPGATVNVGGPINPLAAGGNKAAVVNNSTTGLNVTAGNIVAGGISGTGITTVSGTGTELVTDYIRQDSLVVGAGSLVTIPATFAHKANGISVLTSITGNALSIAPGGVLDINDNDLIVSYAPGQGAATLAVIQQQFLDGYFQTPGVAQITSSTAIADGDKFLALIDNGLYGIPDFQGITLTGNEVIGVYTLFGDLNLDGVVDASDYSVIDSNFGNAGDWIMGDANLDGVVDAADYATVDSNFGKTFLPTVNLGLSLGGGGANAQSIQAVPEPSTLVLGGLGILGTAAFTLRRRRAAQL